MRKVSLFALVSVLILIGATAALAQEDDSGLVWSVRSFATIGGPTFDEEYTNTYGTLFGGGASLDVSLPGLPFVAGLFDVRFDVTTIADWYYLWMLRPEIGVRFQAPLLSWLVPYVYGSSGYGFAGVDHVPSATESGTASGLTWGVGGVVEFKIGRFSVFVDLKYGDFIDLFGGLNLRIGGGWTFDTGLQFVPIDQQIQLEVEPVPELLQQPDATPEERVAVNPDDIDITFVNFDMWPVFPILYKYYDEQPIGTAVIANHGDLHRQSETQRFI